VAAVLPFDTQLGTPIRCALVAAITQGQSPVSKDLARRAGGALIWRGLAEGAEKVIFLARLFILARLLAPEDFGLLAIGMVALTLTLRLTDFGVVASLIQSPETGKRHLDTAWTINVLRGVGIATLLLVAAPWIADAFGEPRATDIIRALALTALLQAAASIQVAKLNRELRFRGLAAIRLSGAIVNTAVAIALAPSLGVWAMVWGAIAGEFAFMVVSYLVAPYRPRFSFSDKSAKGIARFGRWIFLIGIISVATDSMMRWIIGNRLGVAELGLYFMAWRLAYMPLEMIAGLVNEVAFPVYAQLQSDREKAAAAFRGLLVSVAAIMVPTCVVFAWLVPELVHHVLGDGWQGTVSVMQLLILTSIPILLYEGLAPVLKGLGRPAGIAAIETLHLVVLATLGWTLVGALGLTGAGVVWVIAVLLAQVMSAWFAYQIFNTPFAGLGRPLLAIAIASALATVVADRIVGLFPGIVGLAAGILASALVAGTVTVFLDRRFGLGILQTFLGPFPALRRLVGGRTVE
jgi:O-antigen/teichoic acid export membrane protein